MSLEDLPLFHVLLAGTGMTTGLWFAWLYVQRKRLGHLRAEIEGKLAERAFLTSTLSGRPKTGRSAALSAAARRDARAKEMGRATPAEGTVDEPESGAPAKGRMAALLGGGSPPPPPVQEPAQSEEDALADLFAAVRRAEGSPPGEGEGAQPPAPQAPQEPFSLVAAAGAPPASPFAISEDGGPAPELGSRAAALFGGMLGGDASPAGQAAAAAAGTPSAPAAGAEAATGAAPQGVAAGAGSPAAPEPEDPTARNNLARWLSEPQAPQSPSRLRGALGRAGAGGGAAADGAGALTAALSRPQTQSASATPGGAAAQPAGGTDDSGAGAASPAGGSPDDLLFHFSERAYSSALDGGRPGGGGGSGGPTGGAAATGRPGAAGRPARTNLLANWGPASGAAGSSAGGGDLLSAARAGAGGEGQASASPLEGMIGEEGGGGAAGGGVIGGESAPALGMPGPEPSPLAASPAAAPPTAQGGQDQPAEGAAGTDESAANLWSSTFDSAEQGFVSGLGAPGEPAGGAIGEEPPSSPSAADEAAMIGQGEGWGTSGATDAGASAWGDAQGAPAPAVGEDTLGHGPPPEGAALFNELPGSAGAAEHAVGTGAGAAPAPDLPAGSVGPMAPAGSALTDTGIASAEVSPALGDASAAAAAAGLGAAGTGLGPGAPELPQAAGAPTLAPAAPAVAATRPDTMRGTKTVRIGSEGPEVVNRLYSFYDTAGAAQPAAPASPDGGSAAIEKAHAIYKRVMEKSMRGVAAPAAADTTSVEEALAADPANPTMMDRAAAAYAKEGKAEQAVALLEKLVSSSPGREEYHFRLGEQLVAAHRPGDAVAVFEKLIEQFPNGPYALASLSQVLRLKSAAPRPAASRPVGGKPAAPGSPAVKFSLKSKGTPPTGTPQG